MSNQGDLRSVIDQAYASRSIGDMENMVACFHPNARFRIAGSRTLEPLTSIVHGHTDLAEMLAMLVENWDLSGLREDRIVVSGDTAFVYRVGTILHKPSKVELQTEIVDMLVFKDGKIIEFTEFLDTFSVSQLQMKS